MAGTGALTEIVAVERETTDPAGEADPTFIEIGRLRAEVKPLRASESERAGAVRTLSVYSFRVLNRAARAIVIAPDHRLRWGDLVFNVREVRLPSPQEPFAEIIAETGVAL